MSGIKEAMNRNRENGLIGWGGYHLRRLWWRRQTKKRIRYHADLILDWIKRGVRW